MTPAVLAALLNGDIKNATIANTPGGIERQEAEGQRVFVASETLPIECKREEFETLGFEFGEPVDDLFQKVKFPEGWKKRATDHSMWSEIVDKDGAVRATVFYKAAFYDRRAFACIKS